MVEEHHELDLELDRPLLQDVFDTPSLRYISIYMYMIRNELFKDLEDDILIEEFNLLMDFNRPTKFDVEKMCSPDLIKNLIKYKIISNVSDYKIFKMKENDFNIAIDKGIKLEFEDISEEEEEIHIFVKEVFLEKIIRADIPEMTRQKIHKGLERMRAMMCPVSSVIHELIHKYGDYYVLDDSYYYILEDLGNPYQALRIELMIRKMSEKYREFEKKLDKYLSIFHPELAKSKIIRKFKKIIESETGLKKKKKGKKPEDAEEGDNDTTDKNGKSGVSQSGLTSTNSSNRPKIDIETLKEMAKSQEKLDLEKINLKSFDFVEKLKSRIQKGTLPVKFTLQFAKSENDSDDRPVAPDIYIKWKNTLNDLIRIKLKFDIIDKKMDALRAFYSGKNQVMPYIEFIEKTSFNEDGITDYIRDLLVEARNLLKVIADGLSKYDIKELKMMNLELEREIIANGWDEEEED